MKVWFGPPRPHGEVNEDRRVGFVELFYDLVFVVLVSQIAHEIGLHPSWEALWSYLVMFSLVWFAWLNGTQYEDLHGRGDGRSRVYIFAQMGFLAMLAVTAAHAPTDEASGRAFAITYAALITLLMVQWALVLKVDDASFRPTVVTYLAILGFLGLTMVGTAFLSDPQTRLVVWTAVVALTLVANIAIFLRRSTDPTADDAISMTESGAERFGLYTILVLGESVLGVVNGLVGVDKSLMTVGTGIVSLGIGVAMWWTYFDFVGMRRARGRIHRAQQIFLHLPLSASIASVGAAMLGLVGHADEAHTPVAISWTMGGSLAAMLIVMAALVMALPRQPGEERLPLALTLAAGYSLAVAAFAPAPLMLAALLMVGPTVVWAYAFHRAAAHRRLITGVPID